MRRVSPADLIGVRVCVQKSNASACLALAAVDTTIVTVSALPIACGRGLDLTLQVKLSALSRAVHARNRRSEGRLCAWS